MAQQGITNQRIHIGRREKTKRWFKLKYLLLLRAKGGPAMVAKGFSIGLAIEMFTLPTFGLAAVLIVPLVYFFRASWPAALIGFLFGKLIYIPLAFINKAVGHAVVPQALLAHLRLSQQWLWLEKIIIGAMDLIVGGMIVGALLGFVFYFPIKMLLTFYANRRKEKRRTRKDERLSFDEHRKILP